MEGNKELKTSDRNEDEEEGCALYSLPLMIQH